VIEAYKGRAPTYNYTSPFPYDAAYSLDTGVSYSRNGETYVSGANATGTIGYDTNSTTSVTSAAASSSTGGASYPAIPFTSLFAVIMSAFFRSIVNTASRYNGIFSRLQQLTMSGIYTFFPEKQNCFVFLYKY